MPRLVTINIAVHNGEKYLGLCLDGVLEQSYPAELMEVNVLNNNSTDKTWEIVRSYEPRFAERGIKFNLVESGHNYGMWPGQEKLLEHSRGQYIIGLSVDVIIDKDFVKNSVEVMDRDRRIGALQAKVYRYELDKIIDSKFCFLDPPRIIDTIGFRIFRSRKLTNLGHGQGDRAQFNQGREIFGVEGAVPVFRRSALEDCRLASQGGKIFDPDYFWYGDDFDLAWRLNLFGWKQIYAPSVIAWHDRKTTKGLSGSSLGFIRLRRKVPVAKRRLDWRNTTLTIIKNDYLGNILQDLPQILWRHVKLWGYFLIFEPFMVLEVGQLVKLLPRMLKRRGEIMRRARVGSLEIHKWFH